MLPNGIVLYRGPSRINGKPIVAIATGLVRGSENGKTGPVLQTWILSARYHPVDAARSGADESVCGDCPHRPVSGATCYVRLDTAPAQVYKSWKAGSYPRFDPSLHLELFRGRTIRLGSYGEPSAVPSAVWRRLLRVTSAHLGYTRQWRRFPSLRRFLMASCATPGEALEARRRGWRTFRIRLRTEPLLPFEFACPASVEGRYRLTCERCRACDGATRSPGAYSPAIIVHGAPNKVARFESVTRPLVDGRFPLSLV